MLLADQQTNERKNCLKTISNKTNSMKEEDEEKEITTKTNTQKFYQI